MIFNHICQAYQKPHVLANVLYDLVSGLKSCAKCLVDKHGLVAKSYNFEARPK
jgi:hypothetical protein